MSINFNCPNRIKPKLLREQKTEALLVFIRTTLEQHFKIIDNDEIEYPEFGSKEDTEHIYKELNKLLENLKDCVVNSSYLHSLIENSGKSKVLNMLALKEKPMMVYYDSLAKSIKKNLPSGSSWIPELMVICLLSQWIIEEEKSTYLYPFLNDINYLDLMERFDKAKEDETDNKKEIVFNMYKLSTILIDNLKKCSYTTQKNKSKSKKRKKNNFII